SPKRPYSFRVTQILSGGSDGISVCSREDTVLIGRENCDTNFPNDIYMSATHARLDAVEGKVTLTDAGSRNGTYTQIQGETELNHGDYLFLGRQLLRVEMTV
ncbi:MAG: FHA domain-containing protein, partial [Myxococcota bacterium]